MWYLIFEVVMLFELLIIILLAFRVKRIPRKELLDIKEKVEKWNPFTEDVNILEMGLAEYNKRFAGNKEAISVLPLLPKIIDKLL